MLHPSRSAGSPRRFAHARDLTLTVAAIAAAWSLVGFVHLGAYNFIGGSLDLTQRDVRVFDNFTDPSAHDNTVPDPDFPGATGAPLAIWKGAVEWSSERHGTGYGDPHQPGDLGSGGANFDVTWQGLANSVGGVDDNVVSEISGGGGGVFAFTEAPISNGWRIRFYQLPTILHDGPGRFADLSPPNMDIQGIFAHEYGHALGLAHTTDSAATMYSSADPTTIIGMRSIDTDDQNGVRALYGARDAQKPHIAGYTLNGGTLTIAGANFSPAGNEIWFTNASPTADGTPLVVAGIAASNGGATLQLSIPGNVGPGDVLVRARANGGASLSNPFPFDPAIEPCAVPTAYGAAKQTSIGTLPHLSTRGRPRLSTQDLEIVIAGGVPNMRGFVFFGNATDSAPYLGGTRLVSPPLVRVGRFLLDAQGAGALHLPIEAGQVGTTRYYQASFQDALDPVGAGLSDALAIHICP